MWFYAGNGWFFRREQQGGFRLIHVNQDPLSDHPAAEVDAEVSFDGDTTKRLFAYLTGRTHIEAHTFLNPPS